MTAVFLGCFAFGVLFTIVSFVLGAFGAHHIHLGLDVHHGVDIGGHGGHAGPGGHAGHGHGPSISPFNLSTISAFLAWFGGAGYLLSRFSSLTAFSTLALSFLAGIAGGGFIFVTLTRYVLPRLTELRPEAFRIEGALGRVTVPVRAGGVGEVVYTVGGARLVDGAKSANGHALELGTEVVVLRKEHGLLVVERWDALAARNALPPGDGGSTDSGEGHT